MSNRLFGALTCLVFILILGGYAYAGKKTVLIIYSYDTNLAWTQQCDKGIREALPSSVLIERFYMDTKRIPGAEFEQRAREALAAFNRIQPDLVMVSDDNALRLVGPEIAATGVPVVYLGINGNPRNYFKTLPDNVTGVIERIPLFHWMRLLLEIVPKAESVLVLMDQSPTAEAIIKTAFHGRSEVRINNRRVFWKTATNWERWQHFVSEKDHDILVMPIYHALKDQEGTHIPFDKVITWTSEKTPVPLFATQDYAVGDHGVVGAFVIVGEEHGRQAGRIAKGILAGKPIQELSVADDQQGALFFNSRQLHRFGLSLPTKLAGAAIFRR